MQNSVASNTLNLNNLKFKNVSLATIQSIIVIATALAYYCQNFLQLIQSSFQFGAIVLPIAITAVGFFLFFKGNKTKLYPWHFLIILSVVALVFNYEAHVHAQILDGIDQAIDDVGTAAGNSFSATVLDAVIDLIRIAIFVAVAGAVIAAIIFGVVQGQWQAPVLVVGVIVAIGLFIEIMGAVVFG